MKFIWWLLSGIAVCGAVLMLLTETLMARSLVILHEKIHSSEPAAATVQQLRGSPPPTSFPDTHQTLNLVVEEAILKPWKDNDPQVQRCEKPHIRRSPL
jgi:hypothetical protein